MSKKDCNIHRDVPTETAILLEKYGSMQNFVSTLFSTADVYESLVSLGETCNLVFTIGNLVIYLHNFSI